MRELLLSEDTVASEGRGMGRCPIFVDSVKEEEEEEKDDDDDDEPESAGVAIVFAGSSPSAMRMKGDWGRVVVLMETQYGSVTEREAEDGEGERNGSSDETSFAIKSRFHFSKEGP